VLFRSECQVPKDRSRKAGSDACLPAVASMFVGALCWNLKIARTDEMSSFEVIKNA
jgi:hypothetical protein